VNTDTLAEAPEQLAPPSRILIVDDYEPWRRVVSWLLNGLPEWEIVGEAADGLEAVQKAQELQPALTLLDIGLPMFNGIEAACKIHIVAPNTKILFVSVNVCPELVQGALSSGAEGYVAKSDAANELLPAMRSVMNGQRFVGQRFTEYNLLPPEHN